MDYTLDTIRADVAAHLSKEPNAEMSKLLSFASPLFDDIHDKCPALFERLTYFINKIPATLMSINASAEFPRFGIIGPRRDGDLCSSHDLKKFLKFKGLEYKEHQKKRFRAFDERKQVDEIVRDILLRKGIHTELADVECSKIRGRTSGKIFVSPITFMFAIMRGRNTGEFQDYGATLCYVTKIIEEEQKAAQSGVVSEQKTTISDLS